MWRGVIFVIKTMKIVFDDTHSKTVIRNHLRMWLGDNVVIRGYETMMIINTKSSWFLIPKSEIPSFNSPLELLHCCPSPELSLSSSPTLDYTLPRILFFQE